MAIIKIPIEDLEVSIYWWQLLNLVEEEEKKIKNKNGEIKDEK